MIGVMKGPVNVIDGRPVFRAVGTYINWEAINSDPKVIIENSNRIAKRFKPHEGPDIQEPVAVVAYGSSLNETWEEIKKFKVIFTCSGSHKFLIDRGIVPTYHVESDPRPHKVAMLGNPDRNTTYLVSSICHPSYFDLLELHGIEEIYLWHLLFLETEIFNMLPKNEWLWTGGNTVGPRAVKMARLLGYVNHHYFGFDSSQGYAGHHPNTKVLQSIKINGKYYDTTPFWVDHAKMMFEDLDRMPEINWTFHGEGLMQDMAKYRKPVARAKLPMGVVKQ